MAVDSEYSVYSEFDLTQHNKAYVNYLEVVISPEGTVEYAVPSHQEKLIQVACEKLNVGRESLCEMCPPSWYCDFAEWLCHMSGYIAVWTHGHVEGIANNFQIDALDDLVRSGAMRDYREDYMARLELHNERKKLGLVPTLVE